MHNLCVVGFAVFRALSSLLSRCSCVARVCVRLEFLNEMENDFFCPPCEINCIADKASGVVYVCIAKQDGTSNCSKTGDNKRANEKRRKSRKIKWTKNISLSFVSTAVDGCVFQFSMHWIYLGSSAIALDFFFLLLFTFIPLHDSIAGSTVLWKFIGDRILVLVPMLCIVGSIWMCMKLLWCSVQHSHGISFAIVSSSRYLSIDGVRKARSDDIFRFDVAIYFLVRFIAFKNRVGVACENDFIAFGSNIDLTH